MDLKVKKLENTLLKQQNLNSNLVSKVYLGSLRDSSLLNNTQTVAGKLANNFGRQDNNVLFGNNLVSKQNKKLLEYKDISHLKASKPNLFSKNDLGIQSNLLIDKKILKPNLFLKNLSCKSLTRNSPSVFNIQFSNILVPNLFSEELAKCSYKKVLVKSKKPISKKCKAKDVKKTIATCTDVSVKENVINDDTLYHDTYEFSFQISDLEDSYDSYNFLNEKTEENEFIDKPSSCDLKKIEQKNLNVKKIALINLVSVSLLYSPTLEDIKNTTRIQLMKQAKEISLSDPEFIVKLALYTRMHLNIRSVANFLLAYAAFLPDVRPYLKKYFCKSVSLPSDWLNVAELYQTFFDQSINDKSLPTALRKALVEKFPDFDEYQLGKYNKEKIQKKTKSVYVDKEEVYRQCQGDNGNEKVPDLSLVTLKGYTLKELIRKLHISEPVYHVMALLGKKYPSDLESFYKSKLPGTWVQEQAGKRMKLPIPETWETQLSLKGNKSKTWQDLLDHNKLPFMAMLRNLRNMILVGLAEKYHAKILSRLKNKDSVINSKQFPFRFLSAYDVIIDLEKLLQKNLEASLQTVSEALVVKNEKPMPKYKQKLQEKRRAKAACNTYNQAILDRYKKALDSAMKISTVYNIEPISGTTFIVIDIGYNINEENSKSASIFSQCLLLALICKYHSEGGELILASGSNYSIVNSVNEQSILENVAKLKEVAKDLISCNIGSTDLLSYFQTFITLRKKVDNVLVLSYTNSYDFTPFYTAYQNKVNPKCLFVNVSLNDASKQKGAELLGDYFVHVTGFSDQVLRYMSARGSDRQLHYVENIDSTYELKDFKEKRRKQMVDHYRSQIVQRPLMKWKTVRIFISSTFRDMHGERDLLTRYIFPELRRRCYRYCVNIYEIDLRWGITETQANSQKTLDICLTEVRKSDLFVGILGNRYGWSPSEYFSSDSEVIDWLNLQKPGLSITELEMRLFYNREAAETKGFFYFRKDLDKKIIPKKYHKDFIDEKNQDKLESLKEWIRCQHGAEVFSNYPCHWSGVVNDKPMLGGLEEFGQRVLNNLWVAIKKHHIIPLEQKFDTEEVTNKHLLYASNLSKEVVGRKTLLNKIETILVESKNKQDKNILLISGKRGSGKTAIMSKLVETRMINETPCCYFVDAGDNTLQTLLKHLFISLNEAYNVGFDEPISYKAMVSKLSLLLKSISKNNGGENFLIFIDGLDQVHLSAQESRTDWIPDSLPKGCIFVISCFENGHCSKQLSIHKQLIELVKIDVFEYADRAVLVRQLLGYHGKKLEESSFNNQMKFIVSKRDATSPLYLHLVCEELRLFGVFEELNSYLRSIAQTIPELVTYRLKCMELEHGLSLVSCAFALLYFSRNGLTVEELYETLNMTQQSNKSFEQSIPQVPFHKLCQELKMFTRHDLKTNSMHLFGEVRSIIERVYIHCAAADFTFKMHNVLAIFYRKQADPLNNFSWLGNDLRALRELPFHLSASNSWNELKTILCNLEYIKVKLQANQITELLEEFHFAGPKLFTEDACIKETQQFIMANVHILSRHPNLLIQQVLNASNISFVKNQVNVITVGTITLAEKSENISSCVLTLTGMQQGVTSVCVSDDNSMLACGMQDGQLIVYNRSTTKELRCFVGHSAGISACCFATNSKLCSSSFDGTVCVWDVHGGHRLHFSKLHCRQVTSCIATNDGRFFLTTSYDISNPAVLWSTTDGKPAIVYEKITHPFNCAAFDPSNNLLVALGGWDKKIAIWNTVEGTISKVYKGHSSSIRALAYSSSGKYLASSGLTGEIFLWSSMNGTIIGQIYNSNIQKFLYTQTHLVGLTEKSVKVWTESIGCPGNVFISNQPSPNYVLAVTVHENKIFAAYQNGEVCMFFKEGGYTSWKAHNSSIRSISLLIDRVSVHLVTAGDDCLAKRWNISDKTCVAVMSKHTAPIRCVRSRGAIILTASEDFTVCVWPGILFSDQNEIKCQAILRGHAGIVTCCDISSCETMAVSGSSDMSLIIWDLNTYTCLSMINRAHSDGLTTLSWSDVGNYVVTGSNDFLLKLWDIKYIVSKKDDQTSVQEKLVFKGHNSAINSLKYKFGCIASTSADGFLKVWTHKGVEVTTIKAHNSRVNCCEIFSFLKDDSVEWSTSTDKVGIQEKLKAYTPDSLLDVYIYTASDDGSVKAYQPFKPNFLKEMFGHSDVLTDIDVNIKDGSVVTSSVDQSIKVWDLNIETKDSSQMHLDEVSAVAIRVSKSVSCGRDGKVKLFCKTSVFEFAPLLVVAFTSVTFMGSQYVAVGDVRGNLYVLSTLDLSLIEKVNNIYSIEMLSVDQHGIFVAAAALEAITIYKWDSKHLISTKCLSNSGFYNNCISIAGSMLILIKYQSGNSIIEYNKINGFGTVSLETSKTYEINGFPTAMHSFCKDQLVNVLIGYSDGFMSCYMEPVIEEKPKYHSKIHEKEITGFLVINEIMVTSSKDCTVKVWKITEENDFSLKQIGIYFCRSPVNTIAGCVIDDNLNLVVGYSSGYVDQLTVKLN
ncbi:telomerase protein component 1 isoform X1 [Hydra vulgaris]|uniref:telomerase protein component 1 isoform X1 n=1 Tax=Hydra vulgaris TaxID=6087 RepID=UPI001F5ECD1A|nr:telomerase protein component 1 [Hydra vulgaris]